MEGPRENLADISDPASNVEHGRLHGGMLSELPGVVTRWRPTTSSWAEGQQDRCRDRKVSAFAWRSLCQMSLCLVGAELGLLREKGAGGTVHLHRDLVERAGRR